jgi:hypothetical protein
MCAQTVETNHCRPCKSMYRINHKTKPNVLQISNKVQNKVFAKRVVLLLIFYHPYWFDNAVHFGLYAGLYFEEADAT